MECLVCWKHETCQGLPGGVIFENQELLVAHFPVLENEMAPYSGHIIIEMKRHITRPQEMTDVEAACVGLWQKKVSEALEKVLQAEHTYIFRIGDKTPHLHFHVVPRYANTPKELWGTGLYTWAQGPRASSDEIIEISEKLRKFFS